MDLSSIPIMAALKKRMDWLNNNQKVISENVSNADTPGYKAKELEKQDFSNLVSSLSKGGSSSSSSSATSMRVTNSKHMNASGGMSGADATEKDAKGNEESLSGNSVVLEEEMMKLADNQMNYSMVVGLYKKNLNLIKSAMGKGTPGR